jgi:Na+/H+-dicarboxylate symporter
MYQLNLPRFISNDVSLLAGILCGFMSGFMKSEHSIKISSIFANFQKYFFKTLIPLMPFFIFGTVIKLQYDGILDTIYSNYMPIMLVFIVSAYGLILFEFLILSSFKLNRFVEYVRNIIPAVVVGFGSMSSAAALPLLVKAAKDNSKNKDNADIIAPTTVNIHLVGDCFFTPMVAISIISYFGLAIPSLPIYCKFAFYFMIAKFAVAAVPGGGILVALPILQNYLGFNADMLGLITALYVLFDSIITACNVAGNGAMAVIFDRIVYVINERNTISHKKTLLHKEKDKGKAS